MGSIRDRASTEDSLELSRSVERAPILGICRPEAAASSMSFWETVSCHSIIFRSGLEGRASFGRRVGKRRPSAGFTSSNRLTASCRKGTCSLGSSSNCTVCHLTNPSGVSAGVVGGA